MPLESGSEDLAGSSGDLMNDSACRRPKSVRMYCALLEFVMWRRT